MEQHTIYELENPRIRIRSANIVLTKTGGITQAILRVYTTSSPSKQNWGDTFYSKKSELALKYAKSHYSLEWQNKKYGYERPKWKKLEIKTSS